MGLSRVALVQSDNKDLNQAQRNILNQLNQLIDNPLLNGVVVIAVSLLAANNPNTVSHTLNRTPLGYFVVGKSAEATIWDSQSLYQTDPSDTVNNYGPQSVTLLLNTSADTTVNLYVF